MRRKEEPEYTIDIIAADGALNAIHHRGKLNDTKGRCKIEDGNLLTPGTGCIVQHPTFMRDALVEEITSNLNDFPVGKSVRLSWRKHIGFAQADGPGGLMTLHFTKKSLPALKKISKNDDYTVEMANTGGWTYIGMGVEGLFWRKTGEHWGVKLPIIEQEPEIHTATAPAPSEENTYPWLEGVHSMKMASFEMRIYNICKNHRINVCRTTPAVGTIFFGSNRASADAYQEYPIVLKEFVEGKVGNKYFGVKSIDEISGAKKSFTALMNLMEKINAMPDTEKLMDIDDNLSNVIVRDDGSVVVIDAKLPGKRA
eukprot:jgi/Bigna1/71453/fgenesh1_pg.15_\